MVPDEWTSSKDEYLSKTTAKSMECGRHGCLVITCWWRRPCPEQVRRPLRSSFSLWSCRADFLSRERRTKAGVRSFGICQPRIRHARASKDWEARDDLQMREGSLIRQMLLLIYDSLICIFKRSLFLIMRTVSM